jgi:UDP-N-acetyl-2-amino-2-deoxyglucuronate dehydrogenase
LFFPLKLAAKLGELLHKSGINAIFFRFCHPKLPGFRTWLKLKYYQFMLNRFVLIGCGKIAHRHIQEINRTGVLVGLVDTDAVQLSSNCALYGVPGAASLAELMATVAADVAIICSPNALHITHIQQALALQLNVLCEKPLCIHSNEAMAIEQQIGKQEKQVFLVLSARFHPQIQRLRLMMQFAQLGKLLSFQLNACWNRSPPYFEQSSWKGKAGLDGGILYTQFSHYLDALIWCLGPVEPLAVQRANWLHQSTIEGEDTGVALLKTQGNAIGSFHWSVNSTSKNMEISLLVVGEKGTIKIGGEYMQTLLYEMFPAGDPPAVAAASADDAFSGSHHNIIYDQLALALAAKPHRLPRFTDALPTVQLIEAIYSCTQPDILRPAHG